MSITERVASNVRAQVGRQRLTQTQVGAALGLAQCVVSRRTRGITPFTVRELVVLAALLQIPPASLLEGVEGEAS